MKHAKKLLALALALTMILSLSITAFAASGSGTDNNGKITINNTVKDTAYSIYRIFDLESFSDDTPDEDPADGAYSYKVNSAWEGFFAEGAEGRNYVNIDDNGYVTWKTDASAADFAAKAIAFAETNTIAAVAGPTAATADNTPVEFTGLPLGYYLVDSSLGALCALTTTNPEATVTEKNANPTLVKDVQEDSTGNWGNKNDAEINETVNFRATITVQGIAKDYVMHDKMDIGLTFGSVTGVTLNDASVAQENYTVKTDVLHNKNGVLSEDTFDVEFTPAFCKTLKSGDVIVVSYTATLNYAGVYRNADGQITNFNENDAYLEYKDNNGVTKETARSTTKTFTWKTDIFKYYMNGETKAPLAGAKFTLSKNADGSNPIELTSKFAIVEDVKFERAVTPISHYRVATAFDKAEVKTTQIETTETGELFIHGLDEGTYYLTEVTAPNGYNKLSGPIKVVVTSAQDANDATLLTSTVTYYNHTGNTEAPYADAATGTGTIEVENKSGTELPSTGGMGTTIFYMVGSVLLVGAAVLLVTKKRMSAA